MAAKSVSPAMRTSSFSGGLKIGPPLPPELPNLVHWWDGTDPDNVFKDAAGTMKALNGDPVLNVTNKGTEGSALDTLAQGSFILNTDVINGLQVVGNPSTTVGAIIRTALTVPALSASGITIAAVARRTAATLEFVDFTWNVLNVEFGGLTNHVVTEEGGTDYLLGQVPVTDQWVWIYSSLTGGDNNSRVSGGTEVNGAEAYTQPPSALPFLLLFQQGEWAETLIYGIDFSPAQRTSLVSYFDQKYSVLPFIT